MKLEKFVPITKVLPGLKQYTGLEERACTLNAECTRAESGGRECFPSSDYEINSQVSIHSFAWSGVESPEREETRREEWGVQKEKGKGKKKWKGREGQKEKVEEKRKGRDD